MDFAGRPFGPMPDLMAIAEYVTKVHAICMHCGGLATFSHRTHVSQELVLLGETDSYVPLCRSCFDTARAAQETTADKQSHGR
jgi:thymidine kinase